MASAKVTFTGLDTFIQKLDRAGADIDSNLTSAAEKLTEAVKDTFTDVGFGSYNGGRTGRTKGTLDSKVEKAGNTLTLSVGYSMSKNPAAIAAVFMNYGTKAHVIHRYGNPTQPINVRGLVGQNFIDTVDQRSTDKVTQILQEALEEALK